MSFARGVDDADPGRAREGVPVGAQEELRPATRSSTLATGTLACARCDAPVALGPERVSPADPLTCPFCLHRAPVREFLSLAAPSRPARVAIRVVGGRRRVAAGRAS